MDAVENARAQSSKDGRIARKVTFELGLRGLVRLFTGRRAVCRGSCDFRVYLPCSP